MKKQILLKIVLGVLPLFLAACAPSVALDTPENDAYAKTFPAPPENKAGLYLYRDSLLGAIVVKNMFIEGVGNLSSVNKIYYYLLLNPGLYKVCIASEFSPNCVELKMQARKNYFIENYIRFGLFSPGANVGVRQAKEAKKNILKLPRALNPPAFSQKKETASKELKAF